jgi:hypothetical protein
MAKKKKRPSMKPVVKAIARTTEQVEDIFDNASLAQQKKLKPTLRALGDLNKLARGICKARNLSI